MQSEHISAYLHLKGFYWLLLFEFILSGLFLCFPSTRRHWNWIFHLQNMLCSIFSVFLLQAFVSRFIFCYPPFFTWPFVQFEKHSNRLHDNPECWMYDHVVSNCHMAKIDHNLKRFWNHPGCVRERCSRQMTWDQQTFIAKLTKHQTFPLFVNFRDWMKWTYIWLLAKRRKENKATRDQHSQRLCQCAFSSRFAFWRSLLMGLIEDLIGRLTAFWSLRLIELISCDCSWAFRMLIKTEMFEVLQSFTPVLIFFVSRTLSASRF